MIQRILLKNFLAHKRTEIEFAEGVTVLTGPNNSGKSSVVEALRCLAANPVPHFYIRHGAKKAVVEVELEDGVTVRWARKRQGGAVYTVTRPGEEEPRVYAKFGRRPPEDVLDLLKLDLVALEGGGEIDVHIGDQRKPIFMLDQSGWVVADFFAASTESVHLLAMQKALKNHIQEAKTRERDSLAEMEEAEDLLDAFAPLPEMALELERAGSLWKEIQALERTMPALEAAREKLESLAAKTRRRESRANALQRLDAPPALWPAPMLARRVDLLLALRAKADARNAKAGALAPLAPPPELFATAGLAAQGRGLRRARQRLAEAEAGAKRLEPLAPPPDLFPAQALAATMDTAGRLKAKGEALKRKAERLEAAAPPPELFDPAPLSGLLKGLADAGDALDRLEAGVRAAQANLVNFKEHVAERSQAIGACPLCGAVLDPETLLEKGPCHG